MIDKKTLLASLLGASVVLPLPALAQGRDAARHVRETRQLLFTLPPSYLQSAHPHRYTG